MIPKAFINSVGFALLCAASSTAPHAASGSPILNLKDGAAAASEICVGQPVTFSQHALGGVAGVLVVFRVDRVVKGGLSPGQIELWYPVSRQHLTGSDLVLLKGGSEPYTFVRDNGSLSVAVSQNLRYVHSSDAGYNLQWELKNTLRSNVDSLLYGALEQAALVLPRADLEQYVGPHLDSTNVGVRGRAYAAFISSGDTSKIVPALEFVDCCGTNPGSDARSHLPVQLSVAISMAHISTEFIPGVAASLGARSAVARQLASFLLRHTKLKSAAPHLKRALSDPDLEVRYNAVMGLAELVPGSRQPSKEYFASHEGDYVAYWKSKSID